MRCSIRVALCIAASGLIAACRLGAGSAGSAAAADAHPAAGSARTVAAAAAGSRAGALKGSVQGLPLAKANLHRGELLSLACLACHTFKAGAGDGSKGPNLNGIFGRHAARERGFDYSDALRNSGIVWTPQELDKWIASPSDMVAGTKMTFDGYQSASDRRDLIAYLEIATAPPAAKSSAPK